MNALLNDLRHGLVAQRVIGRLDRVGLTLDPYILFREGVRPHQTDWPGLASEFESSVLVASDIAAVAACVSRTEEHIQARLDKGHLCIVLKHGTRIAGYCVGRLRRSERRGLRLRARSRRSVSLRCIHRARNSEGVALPHT